MRMVRCVWLLCVALLLTWPCSTHTAYGGTKRASLPKGGIPTSLPAQTREPLQQLYQGGGDQRGYAVEVLLRDELGTPAALPLLAPLLGDRAPVRLMWARENPGLARDDAAQSFTETPPPFGRGELPLGKYTGQSVGHRAMATMAHQLQGGEGRFTVRALPDGSYGFACMSKAAYAGRYRLVVSAVDIPRSVGNGTVRLVLGKDDVGAAVAAGPGRMGNCLRSWVVETGAKPAGKG